jgi:hypothetical protein
VSRRRPKANCAVRAEHVGRWTVSRVINPLNEKAEELRKAPAAEADWPLGEGAALAHPRPYPSPLGWR